MMIGAVVLMLGLLGGIVGLGGSGGNSSFASAPSQGGGMTGMHSSASQTNENKVLLKEIMNEKQNHSNGTPPARINSIAIGNRIPVDIRNENVAEINDIDLNNVGIQDVVNKILDTPKLSAGGNHIPASNHGLNINWQQITQDEWQRFIALRANDEFNTYAGQLLFSQCENLIRKYDDKLHTNNINNQTKQRYLRDQMRIAVMFQMICDILALKNQFVVYPNTYVEIFYNQYNIQVMNFWSQWDFIDMQFPMKNYYSNLLNTHIQPHGFVNNYVQNLQCELFDLKEVLYKTVKGCLEFWAWKNKRNWSAYTGKKPIQFNNDGQCCWFQAGLQNLTAATANDDINRLGDWGNFIKKVCETQVNLQIETVQSNNVFTGISSSTLLNTFAVEGYNGNMPNFEANAVEAMLEGLSTNKVSNGGSFAKNAIEVMQNIFPEVAEKFRTRECILVAPKDPVLALRGQTINGNTIYRHAHAAVRHLIPGLNNENEGIGADPVGIGNEPNQYAEYKIGYSPDGKLLVYELRGMAICESLPINGTVSYQQNPLLYGKPLTDQSTHARAVIKTDNSPYWHYCDSNMYYFSSKNIRELFRDRRSIMDYNGYQNALPVNHADMLLYHLIDNNTWNDRHE